MSIFKYSRIVPINTFLNAHTYIIIFLVIFNVNNKINYLPILSIHDKSNVLNLKKFMINFVDEICLRYISIGFIV